MPKITQDTNLAGALMPKASLLFYSVLALSFGIPLSAGHATTVETVYDRVMRTQTIRCGYIIWGSMLMKDPNTGQLSGIFHDYTEELGQALNLKIVWAEEEGAADFPAALESGRIDAMCNGVWPNSARARVIDFVRPILYQPMYVYARSDDKRFDNNIDAINNTSITVISVEGATASVIAQHDFPKAKNLQLPQMTSLSDSFVSMVSGKGDVVVSDPSVAHQYEANNPKKIHRVTTKAPLRSFGTCIAVAGGEDRLRRMLDTATDEMLASGEIEKIIVKYDSSPDTLLRVALPYQTIETTH